MGDMFARGLKAGGTLAGLLGLALLGACGKKEEAGGGRESPDREAAAPAAGAPAGGAPAPRDLPEAEAVAQASDWVKREGGSLVLGLANGYNVTLKDDSAAGRTYVYRGFLKSLDEHYVLGSLGDWPRHLLIDARTGSQKEVAGPPRLSPDGSRAAAFRFPADSAQEAVLQVWRKSEDTLRLEHETRQQGWGPEFRDWADSATVRFLKVPLPRPADVSASPSCSLVLVQGAWTLKAP